LGYILDNAPLEQPTTYKFHTTEDAKMTQQRFLENLFFGRKRSFCKTTINRVDKN